MTQELLFLTWPNLPIREPPFRLTHTKSDEKIQWDMPTNISDEKIQSTHHNTPYISLHTFKAKHNKHEYKLIFIRHLLNNNYICFSEKYKISTFC